MSFHLATAYLKLQKKETNKQKERKTKVRKEKKTKYFYSNRPRPENTSRLPSHRP